LSADETGYKLKKNIITSVENLLLRHNKTNIGKRFLKLKLQMQAIAARDIVQAFLGHSYQSRFNNLGTMFKIVRCECVLYFKRLNF